jgi:hypothetical protein
MGNRVLIKPIAVGKRFRHGERAASRQHIVVVVLMHVLHAYVGCFDNWLVIGVVRKAFGLR